MLRIWGRLSSINVRKVVLAARWLGIACERTDAGHEFGIVKTPEYLARNPNGLVPLIEDDGFTLWESNVIVRYLCAKHSPGQLYPLQLVPRFDAERWMDWQQTTFNPAGRGAFVQLMRTLPEKRSDEVVTKSVAATEPLLDVLDAHLARQAFMAGERQFAARREDTHAVVRRIVLGRQHEGRFGQVRPRREVLHLFVGQANAIEHHGQWIAAIRRGGEDVDLLERALLHECLSGKGQVEHAA
jgi:glutathione S-transferase